MQLSSHKLIIRSTKVEEVRTSIETPGYRNLLLSSWAWSETEEGLSALSFERKELPRKMGRLAALCKPLLTSLLVVLFLSGASAAAVPVEANGIVSERPKFALPIPLNRFSMEDIFKYFFEKHAAAFVKKHEADIRKKHEEEMRKKHEEEGKKKEKKGSQVTKTGAPATVTATTTAPSAAKTTGATTSSTKRHILLH